ncbi:uncharacterized protein LOC119720599 [Patiria miniata]|uniref:Uncharacterized protein n=1 Tax=Patiria miniata TaxID=46514 RepID=A0A913Z349_PATMI|nr:uncharacterized protein LOC119720599 [Patiria miniata]
MNKYHTRSHGKPLLDSHQFWGLQTIASSPRDTSHTSSIMITPTSSPTKELDPPALTKFFSSTAAPGPQYSLRYSTRCHDGEKDHENGALSSDDENADDLEDGVDSGIFPLDPSNELDVDQIEQN